MSMLSGQCDRLRDRADELRMLASGMDAPYILPSTKLAMAYAMSSAASELREAADTIEGLRDRLQADALGSGTCENVSELNKDGVADYYFTCSECGLSICADMGIGEIELTSPRSFTWKTGRYEFERCPRCGKAVSA